MTARNWPYWSGRALLYFTVLARARYLTANSPYTANKVRRFTRASLEVVPNGIPDGDFVVPEERQVERQQRLMRPPLVVSVNNGFGPLKNVQRLLEAHGALTQRGMESELHLVGDGYGSEGPCEAWARRTQLSRAVTFMGPLPREEVLREMRRATVLVHPACEESFGMTLIEAMSQGTPVIGGMRSGAVPWVLGGGRAGLLADVGDPRSLADAIASVLLQSELRERLANDGYAHAWQNFRQSQVTDLYLGAYQRLLEERART